jgi:hypothetical protein
MARSVRIKDRGGNLADIGAISMFYSNRYRFLFLYCVNHFDAEGWEFS